MSLTTFHHGITSTESSTIIPIMKSINMSVIGLVSYSDNAEVHAYPYNTPVLLTGITTIDIDLAGEGSLLQACLRTIKAIENVQIVVLRLSDPTDVDTVDILLTSQSRLGVTPRILIAPEMDTPAMTRKLVEIAQKRLGFVYASPRSDEGELLTDTTAIVAYRDKFAARELMLIENGWGEPRLGEVLTPVDRVLIYPPMFSAIDPDNSNDYFIAENVANPTIYEYFKVDGIDVRNKISGAYNYGFIADTNIKLVQGRGSFEGEGGYMCVFELKNGMVKTYLQGEPNHLIEIKYISEFSKYKPEVSSQDSTSSVNSDGSIRFYI